MIDYEEKGKEWSSLRSWLFVLILSGSIITFAMILMSKIVTVPRVWSFGSVETTPSKSIYSTHRPKIQTTEKMIAPLPEGIPMEKETRQVVKP